MNLRTSPPSPFSSLYYGRLFEESDSTIHTSTSRSAGFQIGRVIYMIAALLGVIVSNACLGTLGSFSVGYSPCLVAIYPARGSLCAVGSPWKYVDKHDTSWHPGAGRITAFREVKHFTNISISYPPFFDQRDKIIAKPCTYAYHRVDSKLSTFIHATTDTDR